MLNYWFTLDKQGFGEFLLFFLVKNNFVRLISTNAEGVGGWEGMGTLTKL